MPSWFLKTPIQTEFGPGDRFMAKRPSGSDPQERYHTGLDIEASEGSVILAPEPCTIVDTDRGWSGTAKAVLVHTDSGFSILFGCTALGSSPPIGTHLTTGQMVGSVGYYTKTNGVHSPMLHVQTYNELMSPVQVNHAQAWYLGNPVPNGLIDPLEYMALGVTPSNPAPDIAKQPADLQVQADGGLTGEVPCPVINGQQVCLVNQVEAWYQALVYYHAEMSKVDYIAAEMGLGDRPTKQWTPAAEQALQIALENENIISAYANNEMSGLPSELVGVFVLACQRSRWATEVFRRFITDPVPGKSKSGTGLIAVGGFVLLGAIAVAATWATRKRKRAA